MAQLTADEPVEAITENTSSTARPSLVAPLKIRDFRLVWIGEGVSLLGDQFYMVALPWLVLQLTGSGLAVGSILAVAGIPRALFMLVGGALTDRLSPRRLMLISNALRVVLTGVLTVLVLTHTIQLWMLYGFALAFGLISAFFLPAEGAMLPRLLGNDHLEAGNAIVQITSQLSQFVGPALAGLVIATFTGDVIAGATGSAAASTGGITIAFGFDTLTFVVATLALWLMRTSGKVEKTSSEEPQGLISSIGAGLKAVWQDEAMRLMLIVTAGINFLLTGPMSVGIPVLANTRFTEGAAAFGIIVSTFGGGALAGALLAGSLPRPRRFGIMVLGLISLIGLGMALFAFVSSLPAAVIVGLAMGVGAGYGNVVMISWAQKRIDPGMLGRVMGLLTLSSVGLQPVSQMLSGFMVDVNISLMFLGAGALMGIMTLAAMTSRAIRLIE